MLSNVILLLVVLNVGEALKVTAPPYVCVPTVVIAVVFIVVMPVDSDASGAVPPTIPSKMVLPLPVLVVKANAPLTVLSNVMLLFVVLNVGEAVKVTRATVRLCANCRDRSCVYRGSASRQRCERSRAAYDSVEDGAPVPVTVVKA